LETDLEIVILNEEKMKFLKEFSVEDLEEILSVSHITYSSKQSQQSEYSTETTDYIVCLKNPENFKCVRCWKFTSKTEHEPCERCSNVLNESK
jgi:hypothetical protein